MQGKYLIILIILCRFFLSSHFCSAQDTISKMINFGDKDCYQKAIDKAFVKLNKKYGVISHGVYVIYDLVDTNNKLIFENDTLLLIDRHIYHVVSPWVNEKVSMIIVPYAGNIFSFSGLNCCRKIHDIEDVVHWVKNNIKDIDDVTLERIRNYQLYQLKIMMDPQGSISQCEFRCLNNTLFKQHKHPHIKKPKVIYSDKTLSFLY